MKFMLRISALLLCLLQLTCRDSAQSSTENAWKVVEGGLQLDDGKEVVRYTAAAAIIHLSDLKNGISSGK